MSPHELEVLLQKILGQGIALQPITYILLAVVSLLTAGIGAYFGSYLKRRGQNLATKADFNQVLKQLSLQTAEVENIKSEIQRSGWIQQRRWEMTRDLYVDLLKNLEEIRQKGRWLQLAVGDYENPDPDAENHVRTFATHMAERGTLDKLLAAKAVSNIVVSHGVCMELDELSDAYNVALQQLMNDQSPQAIVTFLRGNLDSLLMATDQAYFNVLQSSRRDLLD